jgi:hypothetical protein
MSNMSTRQLRRIGKNACPYSTGYSFVSIAIVSHIALQHTLTSYSVYSIIPASLSSVHVDSIMFHPVTIVHWRTAIDVGDSMLLQT